jgi:hypothetical protein
MWFVVLFSSSHFTSRNSLISDLYTEWVKTKERAISVLWQVLDLVLKPDHWSPLLHASDLDGLPVDAQSITAVRWSIVGAMLRCDPPALAVNALLQVSGFNSLATLQMRCSHDELLRILKAGIAWLDVWYE